MNRISTYLKGSSEPNVEDYFEMVNTFEFSQLVRKVNGEIVVSMNINQYEKYGDRCEFGKKCTDEHYAFYRKDIIGIASNMIDDTDTFLINITMSDGSLITIFIFNTDADCRTEISENCREFDVYSLYDYFCDKTHVVMMANIHDLFGLEIKFDNVKSCTLDEVEDYQFGLHIDGGNGTSITFPLVDDSFNEIFITEGICADTILIHPYGQPFGEIAIFVRKK